MGYKMARDGKLPVWEGIWLSSMVLLPLGVFFTYKAVGDSAVFNVDAYRNFFRRLTGHGNERSLTLKEVHMADVEKPVALSMLSDFLGLAETEGRRAAALSPLRRLFDGGVDRSLRQPLNQLVDYLSNTTDIYTLNLLNQYPFKPTARNIGSVIATTKSLLDRIGEGRVAEKNDTDGTEDTP